MHAQLLYLDSSVDLTAPHTLQGKASQFSSLRINAPFICLARSFPKSPSLLALISSEDIVVGVGGMIDVVWLLKRSATKTKRRTRTRQEERITRPRSEEERRTRPFTEGKPRSTECHDDHGHGVKKRVAFCLPISNLSDVTKQLAGYFVCLRVGVRVACVSLSSLPSVHPPSDLLELTTKTVGCRRGGHHAFVTQK